MAVSQTPSRDENLPGNHRTPTVNTVDLRWNSPDRPARVDIIGAGPAGLIAAETLASHGYRVTVYDRMASVGRKLLMAGRGGLNLTHSESLDRFKARYARAAGRLGPCLDAFPPEALIAWAAGLGQPTFVGTSGRVFPNSFKASPLLRAWLRRLAGLGVSVRTGADWRGWTTSGGLLFADGTISTPDAVILALGGASWPRLGTTGSWREALGARGVPVEPFRPANCGVLVNWSEVFRDRFAGAPLKNLAFSTGCDTVRGEAVVTDYGLEGGAVYALSAALRDAIDRDGEAVLTLDLAPDLDLSALSRRLGRPGPGQSLANRLRKAASLSPVAANLIREVHGAEPPSDLAGAIKALPIRIVGTRGLERAISTAGGVSWSAVDSDLMLTALPGVFVAGEMLDWEAPTGGYLLQACFATGVAAAKGVMARTPTVGYG